jgi:hypothetical protein
MRAKTLNSIFTLLSGANLFCPFTQRAQSEEQMPQSIFNERKKTLEPHHFKGENRKKRVTLTA